VSEQARCHAAGCGEEALQPYGWVAPGPYCQVHEDGHSEDWVFCNQFGCTRWAVPVRLFSRCAAHGGADYLPAPAPAPAHRCEASGCEREALSGGRRCGAHAWEGDACVVRDCPYQRYRGVGSFCARHHAAWYGATPRVSVEDWLASRPTPLPAPSSVTTHGAPVGEDIDSAALSLARRQGTAVIEAWQAGAYGRADAALAEGRALLAEGAPVNDLRGLAAREAAETERLVDLGMGAVRAQMAQSTIRGFGPVVRLTSPLHVGARQIAPGIYRPADFLALFAHYSGVPVRIEAAPVTREEALAFWEQVGSSAPLLPPLRPCVNAQCPAGGAPRLPGSAFCAGCKP
jgi:hypothetical protein